MRFLSYESKFSQIMIKLCYSAYLNLLWLVCCLPVFTIGASTTALYYAALKIAKGEESYPARMFFRSFRQNFKQATQLWLLLLAVGALLLGDGLALWRLRAGSAGPTAVFWTVLLAAVIAAAVLYTILLIYVFPLVASVSNTNLAMLKNSLLIGTRYLFCTITVFGIHFLMFFLVVRVFTPLLIFGEGLCAMISAVLLKNVIALCSYDPNAPAAEDGEAADGDAGANDADGGDADDAGDAEL